MTSTTGNLAKARAFVIMPFAPEFDDIYDTIQRAVREVDDGLVLVRLDDVRSAGRISDDLATQLSEAQLCIADVSGSNPNVMWEVGYAAALRKPVVAICQADAPLPFDIADIRTLMYERSSINKTLLGPLQEAITQTLTRYHHERPALANRPSLAAQRSIGITGSMRALPTEVDRRLERVLSPYLSASNTTWYCGSFGVVDESAVRVLAASKADVTVVGYSAFDVSGPMLSLLDAYPEVRFIDPISEQVPTSAGAPSSRDVLLASRCDHLIVVWDGKSEGTQSLLAWLSSINKDHSTCFVPPLRRP